VKESSKQQKREKREDEFARAVGEQRSRGRLEKLNDRLDKKPNISVWYCVFKVINETLRRVLPSGRGPAGQNRKTLCPFGRPRAFAFRPVPWCNLTSFVPPVSLKHTTRCGPPRFLTLDPLAHPNHIPRKTVRQASRNYECCRLNRQ
jgi:hypothetical protein